MRMGLKMFFGNFEINQKNQIKEGEEQERERKNRKWEERTYWYKSKQKEEEDTTMEGWKV